VIDENDLHLERQNERRISAFLGVKIDSSNENENSRISIRVTCEFDSNAVDESDLQDEKQFDPRILTPFGIKID
jgi:hypothetical protein